MPIWKLIHIFGMFAAFGLLLIPLYLLIHLVRQGDVRSALAVMAASKTLGRIAFGVFGIGLVGGIATMNTGGWSETSPWLLATYGLLVLVALMDGAVLGPWRKQVERSSRESSQEESITLLLRSRRPVVYAWTTTLVMFAIVSLMVLKPSVDLRLAAPVAAASHQLEVAGHDGMRFEPSSPVVPANSPVQVVLHNQGQLVHDISFASGLKIVAPAGRSSSSSVVTFDRPGDYRFVCSQPGHEAAGMHGTLVVQ